MFLPHKMDGQQQKKKKKKKDHTDPIYAIHMDQKASWNNWKVFSLIYPWILFTMTDLEFCNQGVLSLSYLCPAQVNVNSNGTKWYKVMEL